MARFRLPVLAVALVAVVSAGVWGLGVFDRLTEGGYGDPGSESSRAAEVVARELGATAGDVVAVYRPVTGSIEEPAVGQRVTSTLSALPKSAVAGVAGYWPDRAPQFASADGRSAVMVLTLAGADDGAKLDAYQEIKDRLAVTGLDVQLSGAAPLADASASRSTEDLAFAEAISLPIVLVLLLFIFGSLVAAALPVLVGGCAVLGSLGVLHAVSHTHDVNSFAVNVASLLGLGMAIDYGLFMVGRFREELAAGSAPHLAVARTVGTAGRTVVFSATLLMTALAGLLLFPQGFLKSLAYGGLAAVALAAILSLTLLPALLAVLGHRVDKLPVRLPRRKRAAGAEGTGWARLARLVLRRPVLVALPILAGLLVLAAPIRGVQFGENDERVLPEGDPARVAVETLKSDFPALSSAGVQVVLRGTGGFAPSKEGAAAFADRLNNMHGIDTVTPSGARGTVITYTATLINQDPYSTDARDVVREIRDVRPPAATELLVGGATARNLDSLAATADRLPAMIGLLAGATLLLMFLAFGSVLLPVKAVVMSALSLSATFGVLVWIFQDGHGAGLLNVTPAPPEAGIVVLMAAVVFGLSTDYEVFLLSRMVEARGRGASTEEAVTTGLTRTGRVISAAALLLIVVTGAFALSSVTTMRFVGVGMIVALVLDATVVRMLLVPAVLKLLGNAAWWAPGPLKRLQERAGLAEVSSEPAPPAPRLQLQPTFRQAPVSPPPAASWDMPVAGSAPLPDMPFAGSAPGPAPARISFDQAPGVPQQLGPAHRRLELPAAPSEEAPH
ncbi:MMPL family transporter [Symbioplanes lichenis]|uniref:MMPL family transporter n=1 Tax=Symbioplanes lichenis TaxID=1629072 RepID=UPI002739C96C|nr:efflux RND transporter permease subunit [Actinoplanes lichenis]